MVASFSACRIGYLAHLGAGQMRTLLDRELLTDERIAGLTATESEALRVLREALDFGAALGLERTSSYRHLIDRGADGAVHVVVVAPPDRLEPVTWWFPITGSIAYRGYFDRARAERFANRLAEDGYDVYVRPALLYSTLGVFDDPIPRAMLSWPTHEVAETVLHELVHETIFVAGDSDYNEGIATFIGREAALAYLADRPAEMTRARAAFGDADRFAALLDALARELEATYAELDDPATARAARAPIFRRYQGERFMALDWSSDAYLRFPEVELSNAYLVARRTYQAALPCFARELTARGSLRAFIAGHVESPGHWPDGCEREEP
jgi:predicted aminopeptidase